MLTTLHSVTSRLGPVIIRTIFPTGYCTYCEAVSLARLVEAEIVSPFCGILINPGVGNPSAPSIMALRE